MTTFHLPDLGEGLHEADIVAWHIQEGDDVKVDQLMVSVETAKAVVEVPSPYTGKVTRLLAQVGETVATHQALIDFDLGTQEKQSNQSNSADAGTVVGRMNISDHELVEHTTTRGITPHHPTQTHRPRTLPAARMIAKRLGLDLNQITGTGPQGLITMDDVLHNVNPAHQVANHPSDQLATLGERLAGDFQPITGARRAMAQAMTLSRNEIAMVTVFDDADIHNWKGRVDMTARIIRALCRGVQTEPSLNAVFEPNGPSRRVFNHVDLGIAIDVGDKLFVPVIRDVQTKSLLELREEINRLKQATQDRTLTPEELRDYTITLTNFGTLAGRYATPLVVPPTVAILGTGKVHRDVVATDEGGIEVHSRIPLSLTFDHRSITGGEACRFLAAVIKDIELAD